MHATQKQRVVITAEQRSLVGRLALAYCILGLLEEKYLCSTMSLRSYRGLSLCLLLTVSSRSHSLLSLPICRGREREMFNHAFIGQLKRLIEF